VRVNDAVIGAVLLVLSLAVVWHVRSFPTIPGQTYGAALYPFLVGCGLGVCSLLLIVKGLRERAPIVGTGRGVDAGSPAGHAGMLAAARILAAAAVELLGQPQLIAQAWAAHPRK